MFQYYLPVFFWCKAQLQQHRDSQSGSEGGDAGTSPRPPPLILGISAPQGCGKTTLCEQLQVGMAGGCDFPPRGGFAGLPSVRAGGQLAITPKPKNPKMIGCTLRSSPLVILTGCYV